MQRYVLNAHKEIIDTTFGVQSSSNSMYTPSFNIFPGSPMPIILGDEIPRIERATWGISRDQEDTLAVLGIEKVLGNSEFSTAVQQRPCIIPASGFYMWKKTVKDPLPFYVRRLSLPVLGLAGFYSEYTDANGNVNIQFAVLTMPANVLLKPLEETMPCILEPTDFKKWLSGNAMNIITTKFKDTALIPDLAVYRVPDLVNDPTQNSKDLIQPIPKLREDD